jgi:hypothetical protein
VIEGDKAHRDAAAAIARYAARDAEMEAMCRGLRAQNEELSAATARTGSEFAALRDALDACQRAKAEAESDLAERTAALERIAAAQAGSREGET